MKNKISISNLKKLENTLKIYFKWLKTEDCEWNFFFGFMIKKT